MGLYDKLFPQPDKYLQPDGAVTTFAGEIVSGPDLVLSDLYDKLAPAPAKYLQPDGSITSVLSTTSAFQIGTVVSGDSFPATRPDATALQSGDFVVALGATFPFTIAPVTFERIGDKAIFNGVDWVYSPVPFQNTIAVPVTDAATESLSGLSLTQKAVNDENVTAIDTLAGLVVDLQATAPTADQKDALAGTSGTASGTNKFITDADSRNTNARTPTAHADSHLTGDDLLGLGTAAFLDVGAVSGVAGLDSTSKVPAINSQVESVQGKVGAVDLSDTFSDLATVAGKNPYHGIIARPIGSMNPLPVQIITTTFTLSGATKPISYYYKGKLVNVTADKSTTLSPGTVGLYYIFFDADTGNILNSTVFPGINSTSNVIICSVLWNGSNLGLVADERHNHSRNKDWHQWAHDTVGTRYVSGLTLTHNGGTGAAASFATTAGEIRDEDIQFTTPASSAFPTPNTCRHFWPTSSSAFAWDNAVTTVPFKRGGNNRPCYVRTDTYALVEMASAPNRYINAFVYGSLDLGCPISIVTEEISATLAGTNGYTSASAARAAPFPNLAQFGSRRELKALYRLVIRADGQLQPINLALDDYRLVSSLPMAAGNASTTASSVSFVPYGDITVATVQGGMQELSDKKIGMTAVPEAIGTFTPTEKVKVSILGVEYWIQLDPVL